MPEVPELVSRLAAARRAMASSCWPERGGQPWAQAVSSVDVYRHRARDVGRKRVMMQPSAA